MKRGVFKSLNYLKEVGNYVEHNFEILRESGFNSQEAHISYYEGADHRTKNSAITNSEAIAVQKESKLKFQDLTLQKSSSSYQSTIHNQNKKIDFGMEI